MPPSYTKIPNPLLEKIMKLSKTSEIKIALAACRKIHGFHKESDVLSFSQLQELTDLSRWAVSSGIQRCIEDGILERTKKGMSFEYSFSLKNNQEKVGSDSHQIEPIPVQNNDQFNPNTSKQIEPVDGKRIEPKVVSELNRQLVSELNTQKKEEKESKETQSKENESTPLTPALEVPLETIKAAEKVLSTEKGYRKGPKVIDQVQSRPLGFAWCTAFKRVKGTDYHWLGRDDDKAAEYLEGVKMPIDDIIALAERAWKNTNPKCWNSRNAVTLKFFRYHLNELIQENPIVENKPFKATGAFLEARL